MSVAAGAWKCIRLWDPSQTGLVAEWPHRQSAATNLPSIMTRLGPFSFETTSIFGIEERCGLTFLEERGNEGRLVAEAPLGPPTPQSHRT